MSRVEQIFTPSPFLAIITLSVFQEFYRNSSFFFFFFLDDETISRTNFRLRNYQRCDGVKKDQSRPERLNHGEMAEIPDKINLQFHPGFDLDNLSWLSKDDVITFAVSVTWSPATPKITLLPNIRRLDLHRIFRCKKMSPFGFNFYLLWLNILPGMLT